MADWGGSYLIFDTDAAGTGGRFNTPNGDVRLELRKKVMDVRRNMTTIRSGAWRSTSRGWRPSSSIGSESSAAAVAENIAHAMSLPVAANVILNALEIDRLVSLKILVRIASCGRLSMGAEILVLARDDKHQEKYTER